MDPTLHVDRGRAASRTHRVFVSGKFSLDVQPFWVSENGLDLCVRTSNGLPQRRDAPTPVVTPPRCWSEGRGGGKSADVIDLGNAQPPHLPSPPSVSYGTGFASAPAVNAAATSTAVKARP
jgi:hypothetical protein